MRPAYVTYNAAYTSAHMNDYLPPRAAAMKAFISPASSNVSINETYRTRWAVLWRNEHKDKTIQNMWDQADKHEVVKGASGSVVLCTDDDKFMKPATRHTWLLLPTRWLSRG